MTPQLILFTGEAEQGYHVRLQRRSHGSADVLRSSQVIFPPYIVQTDSHPNIVQTDSHPNIVQTVFVYRKPRHGNMPSCHGVTIKFSHHVLIN